jgi:hypothetical protein
MATRSALLLRAPDSLNGSIADSIEVTADYR